MFCALLMSRYQVSVYRTNGPLVLFGLYMRRQCGLKVHAEQVLAFQESW